MANPDRLTGLDSSFLHLEQGATHMHVAATLVCEGPAPTYDDFAEHVLSRLHLVPRYRQRLAFVPLGQGRPVWVDDPHFNVAYHVRHAGLPAPGGEDELRQLCGRVFAQALDRGRPLWELWLVEGLSDGRFAVLSKAHHALIDGISGVDITTVLFDTAPDPVPVAHEGPAWIPRPLPTGAQLLADALLERATVPGEIVRGVRATLRGPRHVAARLGRTLWGVSAVARAGLQTAPPSPLNLRIGPHRRFTWLQADLGTVKAIKNALGGTVNDVVLAVVAGGLRRYFMRHEQPVDGVTLRAMIPVSVRADVERGALGNKVAAMWASLPIAIEDPVERLLTISAEMAGLKDSGQAVGAQVLTELTGFAPPTIVAQAARLQARQRMFNLVVTNVPGPQFPLYILGRRMQAFFPLVPLAENQALGIAIMSYDGTLDIGLHADYDGLPDVDRLADDLRDAVAELTVAAGASLPAPPRRSRRRAPAPSVD